MNEEQRLVQKRLRVLEHVPMITTERAYTSPIWYGE